MIFNKSFTLNYCLFLHINYTFLFKNHLQYNDTTSYISKKMLVFHNECDIVLDVANMLYHSLNIWLNQNPRTDWTIATHDRIWMAISFSLFCNSISITRRAATVCMLLLISVYISSGEYILKFTRLYRVQVHHICVLTFLCHLCRLRHHPWCRLSFKSFQVTGNLHTLELGSLLIRQTLLDAFLLWNTGSTLLNRAK